MNAQHWRSYLKIRARLAERTELAWVSCNDAVRIAEAIALAAVLSIGICATMNHVASEFRLRTRNDDSVD